MWKAQRPDVWIGQDHSHVHTLSDYFFSLEGQRERKTQRTEGVTYVLRHRQSGIRGSQFKN